MLKQCFAFKAKDSSPRHYRLLASDSVRLLHIA
jgi:hypothetical protein